MHHIPPKNPTEQTIRRRYLLIISIRSAIVFLCFSEARTNRCWTWWPARHSSQHRTTVLALTASPCPQDGARFSSMPMTTPMRLVSPFYKVFFQKMWHFSVFLCWCGEATRTFRPFRVSCGSNLSKWPKGPKAHLLVSESLQKCKAEKSLLASFYQLFMFSRGLCTRQSLYSLPSSTRRLKAVPLTQR